MNDQAVPRPYFMNDQAAVNGHQIQYPSNSYLPMNNNYFVTNHLTCINDQFQQRQQQYHPSLNLASMLTKQEPGYVSSAMENFNPLIYNSTLPFDQDEYFPLAGFNNNFDQIGRNWNLWSYLRWWIHIFVVAFLSLPLICLFLSRRGSFNISHKRE